MSESSNVYDYNNQSKFQMYRVFTKKKTNRQQYQKYSENPVSTLKFWVKAAKEASKKEETLEVDNAIEEQPKTKQHLRKLKEEHTKFLKDFIDNNLVVTLDQMVDALNDKFEGFSISKSGINSSDVIELRSRAVEAWIKDSNISFMQNCIFIDESGFKLHTIRSQGRSKKGGPAKVVVATTRGPSVSILGAICSHGVVNISLKVSKAVMDNVPIHKPEKITEEVNKRGSRISNDRSLQLRQGWIKHSESCFERCLL
ncbi:hypothetical protein G6F43_010786 [Rhizopus delemar]|nr:hypothetical protein G6F43_010786 [Rhizopus delemar]